MGYHIVDILKWPSFLCSNNVSVSAKEQILLGSSREPRDSRTLGIWFALLCPNYSFMTCPTPPYAFLALAVMSRQGGGKEISKPLSKAKYVSQADSPLPQPPNSPPKKVREGHWKAEHQEKKKIRVNRRLAGGQKSPSPLPLGRAFPGLYEDISPGHSDTSDLLPPWQVPVLLSL